MPDWQAIANAMGTDPRYEEAAARGDWRTASFYETYYYPAGGGWYSDAASYAGGKTVEQMAASGHFEYRGTAPTAASLPTLQATPVTPTFDPKIEANALYGKAMGLYTGGYARMGASPAPIVGPYIHDGVVDFIVSFGVPSNPEGDRKIYAIYLDNELAWSSSGGGTLPADGTFAAEAFDFIFKPGTLTQSACSLETAKYPGDEIAYRPQMLLQIIGVPYARFMERTGKPVPYVACDIGDVSNGADPSDGINLGLALERIAYSPWCGYDNLSPGGFKTDGVTDIVDAILIKDNFTIIDLCKNVTGEYRNLDLLLSDMVRVKDRGSIVTPDFVFDRDTIIGKDQPVSVARANATAQRREHELIAIDPDQDYTAVPSLSKIPRDPMVISAAVGKETVTTPLVIDANTRQALATFSQNYQENARRKVAFSVRAIGYEIEPGDLFALTDIAEGFDNEVFKCTQTTHGANWIVEVEGEAILRCSIFGDDIIPESNFVACYNNAFGSPVSTMTFEDADLGAADANRKIIVAIELTTVNTTDTISSVTVNGVSATQAVVASNAGQGALAAVWYAAVPTGAIGDVVVNCSPSSTIYQGAIHIYRVVSTSFAVHDTDTEEATSFSPTDVLLNVPAGGIAIASASARQGGNFTWSGATGVCHFTNDLQTTGSRGSAIYVATEEINRTITIIPTGFSGYERWTLSAASFTI